MSDNPDLAARNRRLGLIIGGLALALSIMTIVLWAIRGLPQGATAVRAQQQRESAGRPDVPTESVAPTAEEQP